MELATTELVTRFTLLERRPDLEARKSDRNQAKCGTEFPKARRAVAVHCPDGEA